MVQYSTKSLTSFTKFWLHTNERSEARKQQQSSVEKENAIDLKNKRLSINVSNISVEEPKDSDLCIDE